MTDLLEEQHIDAGLGLLRGDTGLTVYPDAEGIVPANPAPPYVRVYTNIDRPLDGSGNKLDGRSATWVVRYYCHCVGANEYAAAAVAMRVRTQLLDVVPTIAGRTCFQIKQDASEPTRRDESTGTTVYTRPVVYRLTTVG